MDIDALSKVVEMNGSTGKKSLPRFDKIYEVSKVIGKGNFGVASIVRKKGHRTKYVAKEIRYYDGTDGKFTKSVADMAANEIRVLSRISHPHLVKYIADFEESDRMIIIMDYAGKDLKQIIKKRQKDNKGPFDERRILGWFLQIVLGLKYLHGSSLLHRDIKPGNIFVSSDMSRVKIGDFGLAKALSAPGPQPHTICGTPQYFSPEMCQKDAYSSKADIWSLGCVLYELMTLEHPFAAPNKLKMYGAIIKAEPKDPNPTAQFSEGLVSLVFSLLRADPNERPSAADVLKFPVMELFIQQLSSSDASPPHSPVMNVSVEQSPRGPSLPSIKPQTMKLPPSNNEGGSLHTSFVISDDSDIDRAQSNNATPHATRKDFARRVAEMDAPPMNRSDLDEWITKTFSDAGKRKKIRSAITLALGTYSNGKVPLLDQCRYFDEAMAEMGDAVTPTVHMTLMSLIFSRSE